MAKNQELKSLIGRIKFIHGLTQAQIADELSVQSTYLSDMVNGRVPFSEKFREKLLGAFPDAVENTGNTVTVGTAQQSTVVGGNYYGANTRTHTHAKGENVHLIPVIPRNLYDETDIDTLEYMSENKEELQFSPQVMQFPTFAVFYNVYDDEMLPRFKPGDKLAINPYQQGQEDSIIDGRPYVVDTYSNGLILRKVYKMADGALKLVADNENYRDEIIPRSDVIRVFRVLGLLRNNP